MISEKYKYTALGVTATLLVAERTHTTPATIKANRTIKALIFHSVFASGQRCLDWPLGARTISKPKSTRASRHSWWKL